MALPREYLPATRQSGRVGFKKFFYFASPETTFNSFDLPPFDKLRMTGEVESETPEADFRLN